MCFGINDKTGRENDRIGQKIEFYILISYS